MIMLKKFKQVTLQSLKSTGVATLVHNSGWRRQRLLILAYHGISLSDEHLFNGSQFISADLLHARFELIKKSRCVVLPLGEAVERLYRNDLPDRAVAITFDDGTSDFYRRAFPVIQEFGFPVTLYLTTFYSHYQRPVFDLMISYLLWKGRNHSLDLKDLIGEDLPADLGTHDSRNVVLSHIHAFVRARKLSADEKDAFAASLATHLKVDYDALNDQRMMYNLTADEVSQLAAGGIDVQLHTHRHRTPLDRDLFRREINDNREIIHEMIGTHPTHFCYPSGVYDLRFLPWLREAGVVSATTCEMGFASRNSNKLLLPRFLDNAALTPIEFESWLTGISAALPRRRVQPHAFGGGR
jgi:peptidoglycan/xylan/chitin deacetylase (PgdA/CDA1 family)